MKVTHLALFHLLGFQRGKFYAVLLAILLFSLVSFTHGQSNPCGATDYDCQIKTLQKAIKADSKVSENYYNLGLTYHNAGKFADAVSMYDKFIDLSSKQPKMAAQGYNNRGILNRSLGKSDLAIKDYEKAIEFDPSSSSYLVNRANLFADKGDFDSALRDYDKAISMDAKNYSAHTGRGNVFALRKEHDKAIADLTAAIGLDSTAAEPFYNRALMYSGKKEFAKALADFDQFLTFATISPERTSDAYLGRGIVAYYNGDKQRAIADLSKAIEANPKQIGAYKARALLYHEAGKADLAAADQKKVAELESKPNQ